MLPFPGDNPDEDKARLAAPPSLAFSRLLSPSPAFLVWQARLGCEPPEDVEPSRLEEMDMARQNKREYEAPSNP